MGKMCCSHGFIDNLQLGGPTPIGARKAPLSEKYLSMMQEVALNEQVMASCFVVSMQRLCMQCSEYFFVSCCHVMQLVVCAEDHQYT